MGGKPSTKAQRTMRQRPRDAVEHIGMRDFPHLAQTRPSLHPHDQHQDRQKAPEKRLVKAGIDLFRPTQKPDGQTQKQRRDGRAFERIGQDLTHDSIAIGPAHADRGHPTAGGHCHGCARRAHPCQQDRRDQRRDVHERIKRTDKTLVSNAFGVQHHHACRKGRSRDSAKQARRRHPIHPRNTTHPRQCARPEQHDGHAHKGRSNRRHGQRDQISLAHRNARAKPHLEQQDQHDEFVDRRGHL